MKLSKEAIEGTEELLKSLTTSRLQIGSKYIGFDNSRQDFVVYDYKAKEMKRVKTFRLALEKAGVSIQN